MTPNFATIFATPRVLIGTGFVLFALGFIGCQTTQNQTTAHVTKQIASHASARNSPLAPLEESIRLYGMVPVLPPSEDMQVGDVFAFPVDPDSDSNPVSDPMEVVASSRWSSLPVLKEVEQEYRSRPFWPLTPEEHLQFSTDPDNPKWAEPTNESETSIFVGDVVPTRLRAAHFNILPAVILSRDDANELIPSVAVDLTENTEWDDRKVVMARLGYGETYALSMQKIMGLLVESAPLAAPEPTSESASESTIESTPESAIENQEKADSPIRYVLKDSHRKYLDLIGDNNSDKVWLRVVTEVLYVRSIDISIHSQSAKSDEEDRVFSSELIPPEIVGFDEDDELEDEYQEAEDLEDADLAMEPEDSPLAEESFESQSANREEEREEGTDEILQIVKDRPLDPAYAGFARAAAINKILIDSGIDDLPGSVFRFLSITDNSVALRRIWSRGVAVGIRGLTLEVNKTTGEILSVRVLGVAEH